MYYNCNITHGILYLRYFLCLAGTNINDALLRALHFLNEDDTNDDSLEERPAMIVFLTDGEPTSGITSTSQILANVREQNDGRATLFSLGFGHDLEFTLLQKLSLQNRGLARRIYADSDADLQLEGFYNEVSTPVMSNVDITYVGDVVDSDHVTQTSFPAYYRGSEIIVAGKLKDGVKTLASRVSGHAHSGYMAFDDDIRVSRTEKEAERTASSNFTERLWAYLTIRKLLDTMMKSTVTTEKEEARQEALALSLKV